MDTHKVKTFQPKVTLSYKNLELLHLKGKNLANDIPSSGKTTKNSTYHTLKPKQKQIVKKATTAQESTQPAKDASKKTKKDSQTNNPNNQPFQFSVKPNSLTNRKLSSLPATLSIPLASAETRFAHRCRLAIEQGGSNDPHKNDYLRHVVLKGVEDKIPWSTIESTLEECGAKRKIGKNSFLVQARYKNIVDLICSVRTGNIIVLKKSMRTILKEYDAIITPVIQSFTHCCIIEALASYNTPIHFVNFEKALAKDALECKATTVEIVDYETGAVSMKCYPPQLAEVTDALEQRGYRVLYADYGFRANDLVSLSADDEKHYRKLLSVLIKIPEVEEIYDNLRAASTVN